MQLFPRPHNLFHGSYHDLTMNHSGFVFDTSVLTVSAEIVVQNWCFCFRCQTFVTTDRGLKLVSTLLTRLCTTAYPAANDMVEHRSINCPGSARFLSGPTGYLANLETRHGDRPCVVRRSVPGVVARREDIQDSMQRMSGNSQCRLIETNRSWSRQPFLSSILLPPIQSVPQETLKEQVMEGMFCSLIGFSNCMPSYITTYVITTSRN